VGPQDRIAELEAENAALRARVTELNAQVTEMAGRIADLEKLMGRDSRPPDIERRESPVCGGYPSGHVQYVR
jgi:hypothetical protein